MEGGLNSLPHTSADDQGGYESSWTWDTPSGRGLFKGTPTTTKPGSTVTTSTSKSPGHPFPAPRARAGEAWAKRPGEYVSWGTEMGSKLLGVTTSYFKDQAERQPRTHTLPPASDSKRLGLKAWATTPD